jgi:hypothetical protein
MNSIINNGYSLVKTITESPLLRQGISQADRVLKVFLDRSATLVHSSVRAVQKMSTFQKALVATTVLWIVVGAGAVLIRKAVKSVKLPTKEELAIAAILATIPKKDLEKFRQNLY